MKGYKQKLNFFKKDSKIESKFKLNSNYPDSKIISHKYLRNYYIFLFGYSYIFDI